MRKTVFTLFALFALLSAIFLALYAFCRTGIFLTLAITFCTTFYHFAFRLLIVPMLNPCYDKKMSSFYDASNFWFRRKAFEPGLYRLLQVKRWKAFVPSWDSENFSLKAHTAEEIVDATCHAEFIHEVNALLSFVPLFAAIPFGKFPVFFITSLLSALFELMFVLVQRYNRPRFLLALKKGKQK